LELFYQVVSQPTARLGIGVAMTRGAAAPEVVMAPRVPGDGVFPPERWRAGEWIRDRLLLPVPPDFGGAVDLTLVTSAGERLPMGRLNVPSI
ncbi:MAG TPA: hypothetical protein PKU97_25235, partial [Kofleriaceae bacterium]|nr:hypothetical protein [Kofleriaceae bacterium]